MSEHPAVAQLKGQFGDKVLKVEEFRGQTSVTVPKEEIVAVCTFLRDSCGYNFLTDLCGVDYLGRTPRFTVVYQLYNIGTHTRLRLKAEVEEADCRIDTVTGVWSTANWFERECWDLMGIAFVDHPDLRRILLPEDWSGHPLRKDYPVQGPDREPYQGRLS
ncbi:NADH-quinone oxidoreductase subunit C [Geothermobacter hydrogeniphilus]|uniref:NADH-quinone oxidoreductase subunit C n=1 Tax=Geothermobacter hydrogeniphilus TaxID=1969733 RepID=A0A2K2HBN5_9BACT|nr:NADH-quinone oxidoreductase subunit C [Geothermobacter hydrogeniphilus]PNU20677.1 NADH-quinone oxidoreductase subunit C [Geothermobacter hydrogeniphilus]